LHHSHVGVFETEEEISALLDELGSDLTAWAGHRALALGRHRPGAVHRRYADRIGAMHIKDVS
jgi:sugar phosphate isomerase/epimerase